MLQWSYCIKAMYDMIKANMELGLRNAYKNHTITTESIPCTYYIQWFTMLLILNAIIGITHFLIHNDHF